MNQPVQDTTPFWLKDNFAPVYDEVSATDLAVSGEIPQALNGRLLRNALLNLDIEAEGKEFFDQFTACCKLAKAVKVSCRSPISSTWGKKARS